MMRYQLNNPEKFGNNKIIPFIIPLMKLIGAIITECINTLVILES